MKEIWKTIPGFPKYKASNLGRIKRDRLLAHMNDGYGAPCVSLFREGEGYRLRVGVIILTTFKGPRPLGKECCHWNDIKTDNRISNLRWGTRKENSIDKERNGRNPRTIPPALRNKIRRMRARGKTLEEVGRAAKCTPQAVWKICRELHQHPGSISSSSGQSSSSSSS